MTELPLHFWTLLLHLPGYVVAHFQEESDLRCYRVTVVPEQRIGVCPHCGKTVAAVHQTRTREGIHDLPICQNKVELKVRVCQFECPRCSCVFTPAVPFLAEGAHATERFIERAAEMIRTSDMANVAAFLGVPEQTLARWYYDYLQRRQASPNQALKSIQCVGIDELSLKKNTASSSP
jgi:transposase